jgi:hypothetical protein
MKVMSNTTRKRRQAPAHIEITDRQRNLELLAIPSVRTIVRRSRVSPITANLLVELSGLSLEVPHA